MRAIREAFAGLLVLALSACATRPPSLPVIVESSSVSSPDPCLFGCPTGAPATNRIVKHHDFTLSNNGTRKFADWVAYKVSRDTIGPGGDRTWKADPMLPEAETLEPPDYAGANAKLEYDRGHQAPLASFGKTGFAEETNYLSNITPQKAALNQGSWARLEDAERKLAQTPPYPVVYVVTGPLYEHPMPALPGARGEPHDVPSGYWKVVALADGRTAAFAFEQVTPRADSFCEHLTEMAVVETRSRLDLLPADTGPTSPLAPSLGCTKQ